MTERPNLAELDRATLNPDHFRPYEGETVTLTDDQGNAVETQVMRVVIKPETHGNGARTPFSVFLWSTDGDTPVHQGTHRFEHPDTGEISFFVSRILPHQAHPDGKPDGAGFQIVFN